MKKCAKFQNFTRKWKSLKMLCLKLAKKKQSCAFLVWKVRCAAKNEVFKTWKVYVSVLTSNCTCFWKSKKIRNKIKEEKYYVQWLLLDLHDYHHGIKALQSES